jgi:Fe-S cluster assembly ATP-binding protein
MLEIKDLHVNVDEKPILKGLNLKINPGEIHAMMGPNGAGKSTFARVLAGDSAYAVTCGEVFFDGKNLLALEPQERSHLGLFISFQYPIEIPGISNFQFLHAAYNAKLKAKAEAPVSEEVFHQMLDDHMALVNMNNAFKQRNLNEGFSGGEKKRNEILQMAVLSPKLSVLDETDSGLDIDAMRIVAKGIHSLHKPDRALVLITHYQRLLDYIQPDFVHVILDGKIVKTGGPELAQVLEEKGYDWLG